jgi:hemolysin activation/secretion protein
MAGMGSAVVGLDYGEVGGQGSQYLVGQKLAGAVIGLRGRLSNLQYDLFGSQPVQKPAYFVTANYFCGFSLALML